MGNSVGFNKTPSTSTPVDATLNWWGSNTGPNTPGSDTTSGVDMSNTSPWLVLSLALSPSTITAGETSTVTASVTSDSSGATHLTAPFFPNGIPIAFSVTEDPITPASAPTISGKASSDFTSTTAGAATVSATLDNQTVSLAIVVNPSVAINPNTPPQGTVGTRYADQLSATGGTGTLTFALAGGTTLPPGLSLSNTGLITGTPTTAGTFPFTVTATDQNGASASLPLSIVVNPSVAINPNTPPQGTVGARYADQLSATGGTGTLTFTLAGGTTLPPGLSLSNTGLITGTPTTAGTFPFTVTATDQNGASASLPLSIVVNPSVAINPNTPPQGTVGARYADQLSATGGTGTLTFTLAGGTTLPPGLSLSNTGLITGTPTTAGTFPFTVTATDQNGASASLPLSIVVVPAQVAAPIVQSLQRFGFHAQPTIYVLTFSTALDPARAQDVTNYRLTPIFGRRLGRDIPITAAIYDPVAHTVTLQPAVQVYLFGHYRLAVNGSTPTGVAGATGLLLDGQGTGQPGTDFVTTFGKEILAGPNFPDPTAGRPAHPRSLPKTPHAVPHLQTTSTAASMTHALSASTVDAVLGTVVVPKKPKR